MRNNFLEYLSMEKRFSPHTCLAYKKDITQFEDFAGVQRDADLREIDSRLIRGWIVDLMEQGLKATSVNRKLSSLRTYFKWLLKEGVVSASPMQVVKGPKNEKRLPMFAKKQDLDQKKVDSIFDLSEFDGIRDMLMFEFFYQTGIRLSELIELKDVDVAADRIKVLGKRNKERIIPISKDLSLKIERYKESRDELSVIGDFFFVLNNGKKLYPKFVYRKINGYLGEATDLEKKSPHVLRHTFATHMLNNGAGLEILKELLGHANLSATQVYTHNSFAELTKIYSQSHPRGRQN